MRRDTSRPGAASGGSDHSGSICLTHQHNPQSGLKRRSSDCSSPSTRKQRHRRRPALLAAFTAQAAILVSSVLVSSPAMIAPVGATLVSNIDTVSPRAANLQSSFVAGQVSSSKHSIDVDALSAKLSHSSSYPSSSRQATIQSSYDHAATPLDDIDDHLPQQSHDSILHRQYARQYDGESALFGERDASVFSQESRRDIDPSAGSTKSFNYATHSGHRYSLPSTYPSSIASSWNRPERSVWFQQKAIIITSVFLAIFIVLFIGAAVFLRERKFDEELEGLDDEEALARIEERMNMGRFSEPAEKDDDGQEGGKFKRRLRLLRKRSEKDSSDPNSSIPSSGSSSAVKRKRHLVSRWTRGNLRDSNDTMRGVSDSASIRSGQSARRMALGDPRGAQESVEITYDSDGVEVPRTDRGSDGTTNHALDGSDSTGARSTATGNNDRTDSPPPPPHPDDALRPVLSSQRTASASSADPNANSDGSLRSPRRVQLDDSDFQAADAAETHHNEMRYMPPAYISSGSGGGREPGYDGAAVAAAIARGDAKHGVPAPEERDPSVSPEVISAALSSAPEASSDRYEPTGPVAAHIATDDKAVLGALSAAASMPSAPAVFREMSAPAYGASEESAAGGSSVPPARAPGATAAGPSAPDIEVDGEGFEVARDDAVGSDSGADTRAGKGKAKQVAPSLLPAPPTPVEPAFSPFDQPYRPTGPPGVEAPSSPPPGRASSQSRRSTEAPMSPRKSEKQKEAEQEQQLAQLVASRPDGMDVPRYERDNQASAPPLVDSEHGAATAPGVARSAEHLPVYEQRRRMSGQAQASQPGSMQGSSAPPAEVIASAPAAPSAPSMDDDE